MAAAILTTAATDSIRLSPAILMAVMSIHVENTMQSLGLQQGKDFEKTYGLTKLQPSEYTFSPTLGYISLNTALNPNDVLGIAFQYELDQRTDIQSG
jgi:cell surface protein SprA